MKDLFKSAVLSRLYADKSVKGMFVRYMTVTPLWEKFVHGYIAGALIRFLISLF